MAITASMVKELRERTGAGMMDCKKALVENDGDLDKAVEYLQIKGIAKAAKKAGRVAAEGLVGAFIADDGKSGTLVEVNCETDFVARNDEFVAFVAQLAEHANNAGIGDLDALLASSIGGQTVEDLAKAKIASIGENITVRRVARLTVDGEGVIGSYIHGGGTLGVLARVSSDKAVDASGPVGDLARDVCMHVAASNPQVVSTDEIDDARVEAERHILTEQALESGKPRDIVDKMIVGRLAKWKKEIALLDQPFVKNPELTVAAHAKQVGGEVGASLTVDTFARFARGEGIEKQETNLADEVAALKG